METNLDLSKKDALRQAGEKLLEAALDYWKEYKKATGGAAVVWLTDSDGRLIILSRGEYRQTLMTNIDRLQRDGDEVIRFD